LPERIRRSITGSVLPIVRWPVLRCPSLADFQVSPEALVPAEASLHGRAVSSTSASTAKAVAASRMKPSCIEPAGKCLFMEDASQ
jgi:hypothetical protein